MRNYIVRKLVVILIVLVPVFTYSDCKKQSKCGCNGDILFALSQASATVYWTSESAIQFVLLAEPYNQYNFCNPGAMFSKLADSKSGDILQISGDVFWDCTYLYQQSNTSYNTGAYVYQVEVKDVFSNPYGGTIVPVAK